MTRCELHDIAVRRRGDADVKALLLEIKRLHGVLTEAHKVAGGLPRYDENLNAAAGVMRLLDLLENEPAIDELSDSRPRKPPLERPTENEEERAAKRRARQERR